MLRTVLEWMTLGTSILAGTIAIATSDGIAATIGPTNIAFDTNQFQTYNGPLNSDISYSNEAEAIAALTDDSKYTNVELWPYSEEVLDNVGFSANLGDIDITVHSVTRADWAIFGEQWYDDLLSAYNLTDLVSPEQRQQTINDLQTTGRPRSGDPNISWLALDDETDTIELGLIGHFDLTDRLTQRRHFHTWKWGASRDPGMIAMSEFLNAGWVSGPIQMSEVAKVIIDDEVHWAYSFDAVETQTIAADAKDKTSHSGFYEWTSGLSGEIGGNEEEEIPEPSSVLGLMLVGSLFAACKRQVKRG